MALTNDHAGPRKPLTLAIDIGGSHLKAAVLNASGKMSADPVRVKTPKLAPDAVVAALISPCIVKTKSGRIGDEVRRGLRVI